MPKSFERAPSSAASKPSASNPRFSFVQADIVDAATMRKTIGAYAAANGAEAPVAANTEIERPTLESSSTAELLTDADSDALLAAADRISPKSAVLIRLLMLDGCKVGETIRADASDVRGRPPRLTLCLQSRTARTIGLHADTATSLRKYLGRRRDGPLLLSERRGRVPGRLTRFRSW